VAEEKDVLIGRVFEVGEELASLRVTVNELRGALVVVVWRAIGLVVIQGRGYNSAWRRYVW
jgi:hypothetical protein